MTFKFSNFLSKDIFKKNIKNITLKVLFKFSFFRRAYYWGYHLIPLKILVVNFLFQRIFRVNSFCNWSVHFTSIVLDPNRIHIGQNVAKSFALSSNCYIQGFNGIFIGDNTIFSSGVGIISANHGSDDLNTSTITSSIKIGRNCWLGKNAIILPGVILGDNCIVGAGAIVTKSFDNGSIVAGVPARLLRVK